MLRIAGGGDLVEVIKRRFHRGARFGDFLGEVK